MEPNTTERLSEKDGSKVIVSGKFVVFETSRICKYLDCDRLRGTFCLVLNKVLRAPCVLGYSLPPGCVSGSRGEIEDGEKEPLLEKLRTALGCEAALLGCPQEGHSGSGDRGGAESAVAHQSSAAPPGATHAGPPGLPCG